MASTPSQAHIWTTSLERQPLRPRQSSTIASKSRTWKPRPSFLVWRYPRTLSPGQFHSHRRHTSNEHWNTLEWPTATPNQPHYPQALTSATTYAPKPRRTSCSWSTSLIVLCSEALCGPKLRHTLTCLTLSTRSHNSRQTLAQGIGRLSCTLTPTSVVPWTMPSHTTEEVTRPSSLSDMSMQTMGETAEHNSRRPATFSGWLGERCPGAPSFRLLLHFWLLRQSMWQ